MGAVRINVRVMISVLTAAMFFAALVGISFAQVKNAAAVVETAAGTRSGDTDFIDRRDGKKYRTVVIGGKRWMGENLNYEPPDDSSRCYDNDCFRYYDCNTYRSYDNNSSNCHKCYDNNSSNCDKYGRLYDWGTAMKACPAGWHLPSREEWSDLVNTVGGQNVAGKKLKSTSGWKNKGNGTNNYKFSALPGGGYYVYLKHFNAVGYGGVWWTAGEFYDSHAYILHASHRRDDVHESYNWKDNNFSVRCVMD